MGAAGWEGHDAPAVIGQVVLFTQVAYIPGCGCFAARAAADRRCVRSHRGGECCQPCSFRESPVVFCKRYDADSYKRFSDVPLPGSGERSVRPCYFQPRLKHHLGCNSFSTLCPQSHELG